jgi:hypothetical protein
VKSLEVRVPHTLDRDEVRRRLDTAIARARDEYAEKVGDIDAAWEGEDRLAIALTVMGLDIDGQVELYEAELVVRVEVPAMAGLFAGRIKDGIQERLGGLLAGRPS